MCILWVLNPTQCPPPHFVGEGQCHLSFTCMYECNLSTFQPFFLTQWDALMINQHGYRASVTRSKTKEKSDYGGPKVIYHGFCLYIILTYQNK